MKTKTKLLPYGVLACLASCPLASAQDDAPRFRMDIEVETAAGMLEPPGLHTASTSVLGPAELRASGLVMVADALRHIAGVDVARAGSPGRLTTVRLDGASSSQTLVLLDGVELNSASLGSADLSDLSLDDVERIEIVRGPLSALYGSHAMGGVIQIFTRRGAGRPRGEARLEAGSFGTLAGAVGASGSLARHGGFSVGLSRTDAGGRRYATPAGPLDHDAYENTTVWGGVHLTGPRELALDLDTRYVTAHRELPIEVFGAQVFDRNATQADRHAMLGVRLRGRPAPWAAPWLRIGHSRVHEDFDDPLDPGEEGPFAGAYHARTRAATSGLALGSEVDAARWCRLALGFEWERRRGENRDNLATSFDRRFVTRSGFAQARLSGTSRLREGDQLVATLGVRLDDADPFGDTWNPKLAALWVAPGGGFRVRAGAGRGFRAPSINELVYPFYGNPDLGPERSRSFDVAVGGRLLEGTLDLEIRTFRTDLEDLITTDPESFRATNLDRARVDGLELEVRALPREHLWLRGTLTLQDARDRASGAALLRRPARKGSVSVAWEGSKGPRLVLDVLAAGEQRDLPVQGFPEWTPGWLRVDAAGAWMLPGAGRHLEAYARLENLLDRDYQEIAGFPAPGRSGRLGVRTRF